LTPEQAKVRTSAGAWMCINLVVGVGVLRLRLQNPECAHGRTTSAPMPGVLPVWAKQRNT
jgi:hypothetical protein